MTARRYDFDLFTIGGGSGGVRASRLAASLGARVGLAESSRLGGTCVNVGCVPKKLMVYASHFREDIEQAAGFGWTVGEPTFDWKAFIARKDAEIARLNGVYARLLHAMRVEVMHDRAALVDPHTIEVGGKRVTAEHILIATGGHPIRPTEPGTELAMVSDDVFSLDRRPESIVVVGGGYIGVELAGVFRGMGSKVTLVHRGPHLLQGFDEDARDFLAEEMRKKGIELRLSTTIVGLEKEGDTIACMISEVAEIDAEAVLYAIGRAPCTRGLGLAEAGVKMTAAGAVVVDDLFQSSVPSIRAIGDVIDRVKLTPVALAEGAAVARTLFKGEPTRVDYAGIPTAVFSQPPLAMVGLTEERARAECPAIDVYTSEFRPLKHTLSGSEERTLVKLIVDPRTERVLGAHMVGMDAPEIVQGLAIALKCGATKAQFDATIGIHPSAAEEFVTLREKRPAPKKD